MCRTMFSSMTMASSTTNPTDRVSAIRDRLSRLYPSRYITTKVPTMDIGSATLGMAVAERLRRDRKSTRLNSSHANISYAVFCLKKKNNLNDTTRELIVHVVLAR